MANNLWCIATSHSLTDQVAKKYNITRKQARVIINNSRASDPTLKEDKYLTLANLEESFAFKGSLKKFIQIASEDAIIFKDAPSQKEIEDEMVSYLENEIGEDSREEAQQIMEQIREMDLARKVSIKSAAGITRVFKAFKDPRRLEFIGDWVSRKVTSYMTTLEFDANTRTDWNVPAFSNRADYFINPKSKEVITEWIKKDLRTVADSLDDSELANELRTAADNLGTLLYLFGSRIFREEGIKINPEGNSTVPNVREDSSERNDSDENPDDEEDAEVKSFDSFSTSQQDKSVSTKILPSIKTLLNELYDKEKSGEDKLDPFGYGLSMFLSPALATNTLLKTLKGCKTYNQMMQRLEKSREAIPWVGQIIDHLSSDSKYNSDGTIELSESKKEQLRSAFFRSFRKSFTQFRITQQYMDKDKNILFMDRTINAGQLFDRLSKEVTKLFRKHSGATIFSGGKIDFKQIDALQSRLGSLNAQGTVRNNIDRAASAANQAAASAVNGSPNLNQARSILGKAEKEFRLILKDLGISVGEDPFTAYLTGGQSKGRGIGSMIEFNDRVERLNDLIFFTGRLLDSFDSWNYEMKSGKTTDTPSTNPFAFGEAKSQYATAVRNWYTNIFDKLSEFNPDSIESMTHQGGKSYYSWNNPSFIHDTIDSLSNPNIEERRTFIKDNYCKDSVWYMKPDSTIDEPHFYSEWLEKLYWQENADAIQYAEKVAFCDTKYGKMSDLSYAISIMSDYFSPVAGKRDKAWYRMLIASDKPRYSSILFSRNNTSHRQYLDDGSYIYAEDDYHSTISRQALDFFSQEIRRSSDVVSYAINGKGVRFDNYDLDVSKPEIQEVLEKVKIGQPVTVKDVVKDGKYIFRGTGAAFYINKFILNEIENNTALGRYAVDKIFNQQKNQGKKIIESRIVKPFKEAFQSYMTKVADDYYAYLKDIGAFELKKKYGEKQGEFTYHLKYFWGSMQAWHRNNANYANEVFGNTEEFKEILKKEKVDLEKEPEKFTALKELTALRADIEEFVYNNYSAKANMSEMFDVDMAFYGNTVNLQKRNPQVISSGYAQDPDARIHGDLVSDGTYRSIALKTKKETSLNYYNIKVALDKRESLIKNKDVKRQFHRGKEIILKELAGKIDTTDGQSYTSLTAIRKHMAGQGLWSRSDNPNHDKTGYDDAGNPVFTDEAIYQRFLRGELLAEDYLHVFQQVQKPFVYSPCNTKRSNGRTLTYPVQHKNSECALIYLSAFVASDPNIKLDSQLAAISKFMEETAAKFPTKGIDTANWDSSIKVGGNDGAIDISGLSPQETLQALQKAVYGENGEMYKEGVVTEYPISGYKEVQEKPEHFKKNRQPAGSQKKILAVCNIKDNEQLELNGKTITGKELKKIYFDALAKKTARSMRELKRKFGLDMPHSGSIHVISNTLKNLVSADQKFDVDARRSLNVITVDDVEQFNLPLDEPGLQFSIESSLMSQVRKAFYRQHTNGGIVPQLSAWGVKDDLHVRFFSADPNDAKGLVKTRSEFSGTDEEYEQYLKQNQKGFAYFEAEVTMTDDIKSYLVDKSGNVLPQYINPDGTWNMKEIEEVVPEEKLYIIAYYMPTEGKQSMMLGKIVRFATEAAGSRASYPKDLTKYTGKDFDIDTTTVEMYPNKDNNPDFDEDRILFQCQLAALRSETALGETFKYGEFADLSETSYYEHLLDTGKYTSKQLNAMDFDALKKLCMQEEDMDLMSPVTDLVLYRQNSEAKDMIAIAAVGVTSHAFWSLHNDVDESNPRRDPKKNPQNFLRMKIRVANVKANTSEGLADVQCESFKVINDKDSNNITTKQIGYDNIVDPETGEGEVFLDMMYDMDGRLISDEVGKYVGASADAAKDAAEYRLNITTKTLPILILMHRMGISSDVARTFINQPVLRKVSRILNSASAFSYAKMDDVIDLAAAEIGAECGLSKDEIAQVWTDAQHSTDISLKYSEMIKNKENYNNKKHKKTKSDAIYAMKQLHVFSTLVKLSNSLRNLDSFPRYNSHNAMRGTSFIERYVRRDGLSKLKKNLNADNPRIRLPQDVEIDERFENNEFGRLCSMFPHVAEAALGEQELFERVILNNMRTYSPTLFEAIDKLGLLNDMAGQETSIANIKLLYEGWKSYLLFVADNRIADFNDEKVAQYYTRDFASFFEKEYDRLKNCRDYADVMTNNTFLKEIHSERAGGPSSQFDFDVLTVNHLRLDSGTLEKFKRDWEALLKYPETKKFATDIAIHFLARSAAFSRDSAVTSMPLAIKKAIPNYVKVFREGDKSVRSREDFMKFLMTFMRNNSDIKGIVPKFWNSSKEDRQSIIPDKDNGIIIFDQKKANKLLSYTHDEEGKLIIDLPVINVDNQLYAIMDDEIQSDELEDKTPVYVIKAVPVSSLGIRNVMSEYVGFTSAGSLLENDISELSDEEQEDIFSMEEPILAPIVEGYPQGNKLGSFIYSSPYGDTEGIDKPIGVYLPRNAHPEDTSYIEGRRFMRRVNRVSQAIGLTVDGIHRVNLGGTPSYQIEVMKTGKDTFNTNQHEEAKKLAALSGALGIRTGETTTVKTYVRGAEDANILELSVPVVGGTYTTSLAILDKTSLAYEYDYNAQSIIITVPLDSPKAVQAAIKKLGKLKGTIDLNGTKANYAFVENLTADDRETILNNIINEDTNETGPEDGGTNTESSGQHGVAGNRKQITLGDLATLALQKTEGKKVDNQINEIFNDTPPRLYKPSDSFVSAELANGVIDSLDKDVLEETYNAIDSKRATAEQKIYDVITNIANWIKGNLNNDVLSGMLQSRGISEESSKSIIETIKEKLEELDIC